MKTLRMHFAAAAIVLAALPALSAVNLSLLPTTAHHLGVQYDSATDQWTLATSGNDPYISTAGLQRALRQDETILEFEYVSTAPVAELQVFFGAPASEAASARYKGMPTSAGWSTYAVTIGDAGSAISGWGRRGFQLRLDFGRDAGVGIILRHLRIRSASDGPWSADDGPCSFSRADLLSAGLPLLEIATDDGVEPTCDYVGAPQGCIGAGITNATKVPGRVSITDSDGTSLYDSGPYEKGASGMTVKIRGNTSAYTPKKPYKIKLQKKADLIAGDKKYADKNWVLIKDETQLARNGFEINRLVGMAWTPRCRYVNVMLNGDYRGLYLLTEAVERNTSARIDVASDGYIMELDAYWWNEDGCYINSLSNPVYNYTFKYPDFEEIDADRRLALQAFMESYERSIAVGTYPRYINVESFARWLLGHDLMGTYDSGGSNRYYAKYDSSADSPLWMPNLWDFDSAERCVGRWSNAHLSHFADYFAYYHLQPAFCLEYVKAWRQLEKTLFADIDAFLAAYGSSAEAAAFDRSQDLDGMRWGLDNPTSAANTERSRQWYRTREAWMRSAMSALPAYSAIDAVEAPVAALRLMCVDGMSIAVECPDGDATVAIVSASGRQVAAVAPGVTVELPAPGLYVATAPGFAPLKIVVR